ncbi:uncharacterized protein LOC127152462 isoform X3 [Labeo rohita]|uniref:uncharacterized protein LOC127152462 isoform X3 n=1 Tax=Labeo rohita TaxID=84645 RepID=UPI0021E2B2DF|nr:uncharacterized protein LOC127152462 isoform X3 [Labeo rohita]
MLMKFSLIFLFLACLFLVGICLENDKKTTKRKEQGEEIKIPQPDKRLTVIGKAREALNWTRGAKPRNDMGCTSIGGICQRNTYICQGRYLKDKCRGEKSRWCCTPATAWSALCAGSHHNRARACDSYGCGGFNSRRYFRNSFFPESISWITVMGGSTRELILCVVITASSMLLLLETWVVLLGEQQETLFSMMVSNSITKYTV